MIGDEVQPSSGADVHERERPPSAVASCKEGRPEPGNGAARLVGLDATARHRRPDPEAFTLERRQHGLRSDDVRVGGRRREGRMERVRGALLQRVGPEGCQDRERPFVERWKRTSAPDAREARRQRVVGVRTGDDCDQEPEEPVVSVVPGGEQLTPRGREIFDEALGTRSSSRPKALWSAGSDAVRRAFHAIGASERSSPAFALPSWKPILAQKRRDSRVSGSRSAYGQMTFVAAHLSAELQPAARLRRLGSRPPRRSRFALFGAHCVVLQADAICDGLDARLVQRSRRRFRASGVAGRAHGTHADRRTGATRSRACSLTRKNRLVDRRFGRPFPIHLICRRRRLPFHVLHLGRCRSGSDH